MCTARIGVKRRAALALGLVVPGGGLDHRVGRPQSPRR